uniref:Uncharacterized protein n=1 Tax=Romanomermis culicivorax TaxID=13658 RepID=A0A915J3L3_ROMCU
MDDLRSSEDWLVTEDTVPGVEMPDTVEHLEGEIAPEILFICGSFNVFFSGSKKAVVTVNPPDPDLGGGVDGVVF